MDQTKTVSFTVLSIYFQKHAILCACRQLLSNELYKFFMMNFLNPILRIANRMCQVSNQQIFFYIIALQVVLCSSRSATEL